MKYFVVFGLFVFSLNFYSQNKKTKKLEDFTCEEGTKDAISDAEKGEYLLISYGLAISINIPDYGYYDFRNDYIYEKYGIKFESGGCVITNYSDCYRKKTEELLKAKYGKDILEKSEKEAINLFKNTDDYKNNLKEKIESDYVFSTFRLHNEPYFVGGDDALEDFLGRSTDPYKFGWDKEHVVVEFIVEKNGSISEIQLNSSIKNKELDNDLKNEILQFMLKMPNWKPAVYFNEIVRAEKTIRIVI